MTHTLTYENKQPKSTCCGCHHRRCAIANYSSFIYAFGAIVYRPLMMPSNESTFFNLWRSKIAVFVLLFFPSTKNCAPLFASHPMSTRDWTTTNREEKKPIGNCHFVFLVRYIVYLLSVQFVRMRVEINFVSGRLLLRAVVRRKNRSLIIAPNIFTFHWCDVVAFIIKRDARKEIYVFYLIQFLCLFDTFDNGYVAPHRYNCSDQCVFFPARDSPIQLCSGLDRFTRCHLQILHAHLFDLFRMKIYSYLQRIAYAWGVVSSPHAIFTRPFFIVN